MKNFGLLGLLTLIAFSFGACEEDNTNPPPSNESKSMEVTIDGKLWQGSISNTASSGGTFQVKAQNPDDSTQIQLFFPADSTGNFDLIEDPATVSYGEIGTQGISSALSGYIRVEQAELSQARGSFEAELTGFSSSADTLDLVGGSFNWEP